MKSVSTVSAVLVAAVMSLQPLATFAYPHYTFQAFSGGACDGSAGSLLEIPKPSSNTKYIDFTGRYSFRITEPSSGNEDGEYVAYVSACRKKDCSGGVTNYVWTADKSGCINVNTGFGVDGMALFTTMGGI